jgi:hypothetical protein
LNEPTLEIKCAIAFFLLEELKEMREKSPRKYKKKMEEILSSFREAILSNITDYLNDPEEYKKRNNSN